MRVTFILIQYLVTFSLLLNQEKFAGRNDLAVIQLTYLRANNHLQLMPIFVMVSRMGNKSETLSILCPSLEIANYRFQIQFILHLSLFLPFSPTCSYLLLLEHALNVDKTTNNYAFINRKGCFAIVEILITLNSPSSSSPSSSSAALIAHNFYLRCPVLSLAYLGHIFTCSI